MVTRVATVAFEGIGEAHYRDFPGCAAVYKRLKNQQFRVARLRSRFLVNGRVSLLLLP
ncbi:hypothetical protein [Methylobacterium iners]|uniref:Transposase n=1 Tax=Methylobacterium iners TaxID=418707 RepID=A0ABQ4RV66_9HYPH|nr:hypothetical protein [Methylobacterium iners]GJD94270.1 hypothetical protein OCOJLMKI_1472 [Methylobacterium iners]